MAVNTTFSMMVQLLSESVDANTSLTDIMKTALKARLAVLPAFEPNEFTSGNVESSTGATIDQANDSITIASGDSATIEWDPITFGTPVRIEGADTEIGALVGNVGQGTNSPVANADITLQYRDVASGTWKAFGRTVRIDETSYFQLRALIATQGDDADLPQLHIIAEQL